MSGGGALHGLEEVGLSCNAKVVSIDYGCVSSDVDGADGLGEKKVKERRKG